MKSAQQLAKVIAFSIGILLTLIARSQEFSAGINTETPNTNAVLHLVSPNSNQGLLIPTLTTAQRTSMTLAATDNGMLVFDTGTGLFYYYFNGWIALTTAASETDPTVPATIKDGIDWTELTGIPGVFADNTDDVNDLDADPANELISSAALAGNILTITEAGTPYSVDLSTLTSAAQDLQFAGNILSITGDPTPTLVDFSAWDQNAADDITTANVGTAANQIVQLNGSGQLPAIDGSLLTNILNTVATDGTTITGDGVGTPLTANVGTGPNQIVQLDGSGFLPALDGSALTGVTSTVTVDGTTITGDGSGAPLQISSVPLTNLAAGVATPSQNIEFNGTNWGPGTDDIGIADGTTIIGDGSGTPYAVNVGTGPNQIVQLDGTGVLPVIDGSNLTGVTSAVTTDGTTITGDGSGTPLAVGAVQLTNIGVGGALAGQVIEFDGTNWVPATDDGLTAVATDITLVGDGAGVPLSLNRVNPAIIAAGGATAGQILEFNGTNWVPVANSGLTTVATDGTTIAGDGVGTPLSLSAVPLTTIAAGGATLGQSLEFNGTNWIPAADDGMLATTYDPNTIAGDAFNFDTHASTTAAVAGNVLTFNGTTWDAAAPAGITLPYSQSLADIADLFFLTNTGAGGAGAFEINNAANASNALNATTNGTGSALRISHGGIGVGTGIDIGLSQATSTGPGIRINHAGLGAGIEINTATGPPMFISGGLAGEVLTSDALGNITLQPGGLTLPYTQTVTDPGDLFYLVNDGTGGAGAFQILNAASSATTLSANTNGTGSAILASQTGASGPGIDVSITGAANPNAGVLINHAGTGPGIDVNTVAGPNIRLNGATPFQIPTGAALGYVLTSVDASGNTVWAPPLTLPFADTVADPGTLFDITNSGAGAAASFTSTGIAALFSTTGATSAIQVDGDIEYLEGVDRFLGIPASTTGAGNVLTMISGSAGGVGGNGGDLNLRSGDAATAGDGGNIIIATGAGAGVGNFGQVLVNGVTRIGNPTAGLGGSIELEDDGGANAVAIQADPTTTAYAMTLPTANGSGVLTNDGAGALTWAPSPGFTLPYGNSLADAGPLFSLSNSGVGSAAFFENTSNSNALEIRGNAIFLDGFQRDIGILPSLTGPGDVLNIFSGGAGGAGGAGGDLNLRSGQAAVVGNGGNILLEPGPGAGGGNFGGVFVNGITRFGNPNGGFGGLMELENDGGTATIGIEADPAMAASYTIRLPGTQGSGALTNDGTGALSWINSSSAFILDANSNLLGNTTVAAITTGSDNFLAGVNSGISMTTGFDNIYIGQTSGFSTQDGVYNIGIGTNSGSNITSGQGNVLIGQDAGGASLTTGIGNVIIGQGASTIDNTSPHVVIGQGATADGFQAVAIGPSASATGSGSIAIGAGVDVTSNDVAVIGNPASIFGVGIGTATPAARLHVERAAGSGGNVITGTNLGTSGSAGFFDISNATNASDVVSATTTGTGRAGVFTINNATSLANALEASTTGTGSSLALNHSGATGTGISIDMNGTGDQAIFIGGTTPGGASIQADGDITTAANFNGGNMTLLGDAEIQRNFITPTLPYDVGGSGPLLPNTNRVLKLNNPGIDIDEISGVGALDGQEILLIVEIAGAPFNVNSGVVNLRLDNNGAFTMDTGSTLHLMWIETMSQWVEISRSR